MAIQINDNLRISAPKLVDDRTLKEDGTPYSSKAEVLTTIIASRRALGLIVLIGTDFYYFKTGTTSESHLQPLTISGGVQSVTGGIVDNTDPLNPVVTFTPENYDLIQFSNESSNPFVRLSELDGKVDKVTGYGLSQQNYTSAEKTKLSGIENNAQVNSIELIKRNGVILPIDPADKSVNIIVDGSGGAGDFIPLSGTEVGSPLTGNIEVDPTNENVGFYSEGNNRFIGLTDDGFNSIKSDDSSESSNIEQVPGGNRLTSSNSNSQYSDIQTNPTRILLRSADNEDNKGYSGEFSIENYDFRFDSKAEHGDDFDGSLWYNAEEGLIVRDNKGGYSRLIKEGLSGRHDDRFYSLHKRSADSTESNLLFPDSGSTPRRIPVSVNGNFADQQGNIEVLADQIHNNLTGLQGGTVTQRYHLNQTEYEYVQEITPLRNPPTRGTIVFDPTLPPAIVGIGTGHGQIVLRDSNGNIKIDVKPIDDEDLADFGTVKEMTKHNIRVVDANNEIIETTTPHTLVLVSNPVSTTIRIEPATSANIGYSVKIKVSGISSVLTSQGGSRIVDMDNVPQDDITLSGAVAEFISDGSNWQLVTVLR